MKAAMKDAVRRSKGNRDQAKSSKARWKEQANQRRKIQAYFGLAVLVPLALVCLLYPLHTFGYFRLWKPSALSAALRSPETTKSLDLSRQFLKEVPPEIGELQKLETLDLDSNELKALGDDLPKLQNLKILRVSYNQLGELSPNIGKLNNLRELHLSGNQLKELPKELFTLSNLEVLNLKNNSLTSLPPDLGKLKKLKVLDIKNNRIANLPEGLSSLRNLEKLYLSGNSLSTFPELTQLRKLKNVTVRDSGLSSGEVERLRTQLGKDAIVNS
jgi:Leucine-rich repeat (LRR) protein